MTETSKAFPEEIFLKLETLNNDDPYFVHYESATELAEPDKEIEVGVYRLVHTARVKASVSVEGTNQEIVGEGAAERRVRAGDRSVA